MFSMLMTNHITSACPWQCTHLCVGGKGDIIWTVGLLKPHYPHSLHFRDSNFQTWAKVSIVMSLSLSRYFSSTWCMSSSKTDRPTHFTFWRVLFYGAQIDKRWTLSSCKLFFFIQSHLQVSSISYKKLLRHPLQFQDTPFNLLWPNVSHCNSKPFNTTWSAAFISLGWTQPFNLWVRG